MEPHKIVSREDWLIARKAHLENEKALTRARDRLLEERRALPWVKVEETYIFDGPDGEVSLADLFDGRSQLIVYHFMFGPGWKEGCPSCSLHVDHIDAVNLHLAYHDVTVAAVSRAPWREIAPFKKRMGWKFPWVSSYGNDFNYDYHVSFTPEDKRRNRSYYNYRQEEYLHDELPGISVFYKDEAGEIFHTYSAYARGDETMIGAFMYLDVAPKGRNETEAMDWVRHHDRYEDTPKISVTAALLPIAPASCCSG